MLITPNANFPTGRLGLIAVDKMGNKVLFLDPDNFEVLETLGGFAPRVHELAISPDHIRAYVPIYGGGRHGANPNPGHLIAVFDLQKRRHSGDFSVSPFLAPHGLRWGPAGQLYCVCEDSGVILEMDATTGVIQHVIALNSTNAHRIEILPDGSKLYVENEEDPFATVVDLRLRRAIKQIPVPNGLAGLGLSPDGKTLVLVDAQRPDLIVLDTATDTIIRTVRLSGHTRAAQIARYSPDGRYLVVTSHDEACATILSPDLATQRTVPLGKGPMDIAFHPNGRLALVGNQDAGTISVLDLAFAVVSQTIEAGQGVEVLAFF